MKYLTIMTIVFLLILAASVLSAADPPGNKDCRDVALKCKDSGGCDADRWYTDTCVIECKVGEDFECGIKTDP